LRLPRVTKPDCYVAKIYINMWDQRFKFHRDAVLDDLRHPQITPLHHQDKGAAHQYQRHA